jgi:hypothetical protein
VRSRFPGRSARTHKSGSQPAFGKQIDKKMKFVSQGLWNCRECIENNRFNTFTVGGVIALQLERSI